MGVPKLVEWGTDYGFVLVVIACWYYGLDPNDIAVSLITVLWIYTVLVIPELLYDKATRAAQTLTPTLEDIHDDEDKSVEGAQEAEVTAWVSDAESEGASSEAPSLTPPPSPRRPASLSLSEVRRDDLLGLQDVILGKIN